MVRRSRSLWYTCYHVTLKPLLPAVNRSFLPAILLPTKPYHLPPDDSVSYRHPHLPLDTITFHRASPSPVSNNNLTVNAHRKLYLTSIDNLHIPAVISQHMIISQHTIISCLYQQQITISLKLTAVTYLNNNFPHPSLTYTLEFSKFISIDTRINRIVLQQILQNLQGWCREVDSSSVGWWEGDTEKKSNKRCQQAKEEDIGNNTRRQTINTMR